MLPNIQLIAVSQNQIKADVLFYSLERLYLVHLNEKRYTMHTA